MPDADAPQELGVKATFFVIGALAEGRPEMIRRMAAEGHTIGSHTYSHFNLTALEVSD